MSALNKSVLVLLLASIGCGQQLVEFANPTIPTVTSTDPVNVATNIGVSRTVNATFSEQMNASTLSATTFTLKQGAAAVAGSVTYAGMTATFTPASDLAASTAFTASISTDVKSSASSTGLAANYVWSFTTAAGATGSGPTPPAVNSTDPGNSSTGVVTSKQITAVFNKTMNPATINASTFTLKQGTTSIAGAVSYAGTTARFVPNSLLGNNLQYDATITTGAKDTGALGIAADYKWSFTTAAIIAGQPPQVVSTDPLNNATGVDTAKQVSAVFNQSMDPTTITSLTFTLKQGINSVAGSVSYAGFTATFAPTSPLASNTTYGATVTSGAKNMSGIGLVADYPWSFTTAAAPPPPLAINLGRASTYGIAASAGLSSTGVTQVNGDVALYPTATCNDATGTGGPNCDSKTYAQPLGLTVNGSIYFAADPFDNGVTANAVKNDLNSAWVEGMNKADTQAVGYLVGQIGGKIIPPGVYEEGSTLNLASGTTATLDAGGDANAIFIFKVGSSLSDSGITANPSKILLINNAQARNVWFVVAFDATIGSGTIWNGNILAGRTATVNTGSSVTGRVLGGANQPSGAITLINTAAAPSVTSITVPQ